MSAAAVAAAPPMTGGQRPAASPPPWRSGTAAGSPPASGAAGPPVGPWRRARHLAQAATGQANGRSAGGAPAPPAAAERDVDMDCMSDDSRAQEGARPAPAEEARVRWVQAKRTLAAVTRFGPPELVHLVKTQVH